jgi:hypothetical protein
MENPAQRAEWRHRETANAKVSGAVIVADGAKVGRQGCTGVGGETGDFVCFGSF